MDIQISGSRPAAGRAGTAAKSASIILVAFSRLLAAQNIPGWYPLEIGNQWTYEHESLGGNARNPDVVRWKTIETIRGFLERPEGTVVLRDVRTVESTRGGSWIANFGDFHYLLRDNCIYFLVPPDWDEVTQQLRPEFRDYLLRGELPPALCFPLSVGKHWQAATNSEFAWTVAGIGPGDGFAPSSVSPQDFQLITRTAGSGGTEHLWFRKGIGITGRWYWHNGTYTEDRVRLVDWRVIER